MKAHDIIIVGGGHNGLACAAYLARAGRKVLVLERRERVGGAAMSEEVFPGFRFSVFSYVVSLLRPEIIRELELARHGLHILPLESTLTPLANNDHLVQWSDHDQNRRELARHSLRDAEAYDEFGLLLHRMARAVKPLLSTAPPDPASLDPRELFDLLRLGRYFRGLPEKDLHALWKLLTMSAADYLDEWFESEALKGTKSASGIIGTLVRHAVCGSLVARPTSVYRRSRPFQPISMPTNCHCGPRALSASSACFPTNCSFFRFTAQARSSSNGEESWLSISALRAGT